MLVLSSLARWAIGDRGGAGRAIEPEHAADGQQDRHDHSLESVSRNIVVHHG
ncbi:MAG TPA: hypothetical protein VLG36_03760 [Candidatus Chromulinivoraceae bacterium]|nr:hypothetical protein [Candidatus Chromulinivoraceae bacterium]